ncbi:pectate lyase [Micromonospora sp. KC723]|nr:pectate lyase [Micromonospora sp. KC723]
MRTVPGHVPGRPCAVPVHPSARGGDSVHTTPKRTRRGRAAVGAAVLAATLVAGFGPVANAAPAARDVVAAPAAAAPVTILASWPSPSGSVKVNATIPVPSSGLNGGMKRYYGIGDGGQSEKQDPMFELAPGATLRNVIIGAPAGDGVHCKGNCTLVNVWWEDVGEDAATFTGGSSYTVDGGGARSGSDKVFQHNGAGTVTIRNFQVENSGKLYRACGNCSTSHQRHVVLQNVTATKVKTLVGINSNWGDTARFSNITVVGDSGRKTKICTRFQGVKKGSEPKELGSGPDSRHCLYRDSDVTWR